MANGKTTKTQNKSGLGKSIIRARFKGHRPHADDTNLVMTDSMNVEERGLKSITHENDLDAFIHTAEMAGTDFVAERMNVQIIQYNATNNPFLLSVEDEKDMLQKIEDNKEKLMIPRRPTWTSDTTHQELDMLERTAFLEWRRNLAFLEENMQMILTPFERNLEVWRQLWRVIERSDLVVQIVDARNPLFFRCEDLESYVTQVDKSKKNILLINKSDFLTLGQREVWAEYFRNAGLSFLFFSALEAQELNELEKEMDKEHQAAPEEMSEDKPVEEPVPEVIVEERHIEENTTEVLGCEDLCAFFKRFIPEGKTRITVGLVGYPNVGKSSTINALLGMKKVTVSATPGKTKHFQTLILTEQITLCDCPGLVFPTFATTQAQMVVNGVLPIDNIREYTAPSTIVAQRIPRFFLEWIYGILLPAETDPVTEEVKKLTGSEVLFAYATIRGFRRAGQGNPDEARASRFFLKDYVNGKLLYCHPPPDTVDGEKFNEELYAVGGPKYQEAELARLSAGTKEVKHAEAIMQQNLTRDSNLMGNDKVNKGHVVGKFKHLGADFQRVQLFPHQSGYINHPESADSLTGSMAGSVRSLGTTASQREAGGKKAHKKVPRVKDHSWRV